MKNEIVIKDGSIVTFVAMQWIEDGWEFDFPSMLLDPVVRFHESGMHCEVVIEDAVIDAEVEGKLRGEEVSEFRGNLKYLRRVAREVKAGKKFPKKSYSVTEEDIRFYRNDDDELESEIIDIREFDGE